MQDASPNAGPYGRRPQLLRCFQYVYVILTGQAKDIVSLTELDMIRGLKLQINKIVDHVGCSTFGRRCGSSGRKCGQQGSGAISGLGCRTENRSRIVLVDSVGNESSSILKGYVECHAAAPVAMAKLEERNCWRSWAM